MSVKDLYIFEIMIQFILIYAAKPKSQSSQKL